MKLKGFPYRNSFCTGSALVLVSAILGAQTVQASISLDLNSPASIKNAAKIAAEGMMQYYTGYRPGDVPGNLPDPYYWWEAGAMFESLIEYWYYTGDSTFNKKTTQAMLWQVGTENNYMPQNQTTTLGNDDQAFWGMAALTAAEVKYPNPPEDQPQWLALAQAVFNSQAHRWNTEKCGGGLKWQIFPFNNGYNYRNTISNGCFFNMASRLAVYTNNDTYADWAETAWDWTLAIGLANKNYQFFDGTDDTKNCTTLNHMQWTYNAGVYLYGAASMYNYTDGSEIWKERLLGIIKGLNTFFPKEDIMAEVACESTGKCNIDQRSFKAYLSSWMGATVQLAPFTRSLIMPKLRASAKAAAEQCNGPDNACGMRWNQHEKYGGVTGVGEQMAALEIFLVQLIDDVKPRVTNSTGGTSKGDPNAGTGTSDADSVGLGGPPISTADRAGAGIVTALVIIAAVGGAYFMVS